MGRTCLRSATDGQGLVEYALIIALISIATVAAIATTGGGVFAIYSGIQASLISAGM